MKAILIIITGLTLLFISACQPIEQDSALNGAITSALERELQPNVDPLVWQSLANDHTAFALAFYNSIRSEHDNLIFSPFSLALALSMTLAGAETTTEQAMRDALKLSLDENQIHPAFNALLLAIDESESIQAETEEGSFQLNIANSIWGQSGFEFKQAFLDTLALNYGAGLNTVNFIEDPESARLAINEWVEVETDEKIQDLIPADAITPLTRLVLANAIYFKGSWFFQFDPGYTKPEPFFMLDGTEVSVEMMKLYDEQLPYLQDDNFQSVRLPFLSSDFAMTIIVPKPGMFVEVENGLTASFLANISQRMSSERINLEMPKFDFETTINANEALISLGMEVAFDPTQSDFTGIADVDDLHISDVIHQATINVDEEGTEAAAATAVIVGVESMPVGDPISLVIDHPFIIMIQHLPTGSILFLGRVLQP